MALLQRAVEHRERAVHLAPVAASRSLVVRTLHRHVGRFADRERFGDCVLERVAFIANVGNVARRAGRARRRSAGDEFSAIGVAPGLVDEPARHAERAFINGIAHEQHLRCTFVCVERTRRIAGYAAARGPESNQRRNVERDAAGFDEREETVERRPRDLERVVARGARFGRQGESPQRRDRRAAVAGDLGRDALPKLSLAAAVDEPKFIRMGMHVDETGDQSQAIAGDALVGVPIVQSADRDDAALGDADIGGKRRGTRPIEHSRPFEDGGEHRLT